MAFEILKRIFNPNKVEIELEDIQSMILRSRPIPYFGTMAAIRINSPEAGKEMIKAVLPLVHSAQDWDKNEGATVFLTFTYKGLEALGLPKDSLDSFPESF